MRAEHLKILLADVPALELLAFAATELANADVPAGSSSRCLQTRWRRVRHHNWRRFPPPCFASLPIRGHMRAMRRLDRSNMHCKREQARTLWQRVCPRSWNFGTTQSLCRSMSTEPMTPCLVHSSSLPSKPPRRNCSSSFGNIHRLTAGGTLGAIAETSPKATAVSGCAPSLRSAVEAHEHFQAEGWHE